MRLSSGPRDSAGGGGGGSSARGATPSAAEGGGGQTRVKEIRDFEFPKQVAESGKTGVLLLVEFYGPRCPVLLLPAAVTQFSRKNGCCEERPYRAWFSPQR